MKTQKSLWLLVGFAFLFTACQLPVERASAKTTGKGQLMLSLDQKRTAVPFASESLMNLVSYTLTLTPDGGSAMAALGASSPEFVVPNLAAGKYAIEAQGLNAEGSVLARASGTVVIVPDELERVALTLAPFGSGTISAVVDWSGVPELTTLNSPGAKVLKLWFDGTAVSYTTADNRATYTVSEVPAGPHLVLWQIVNPLGSIVWGTKEVFHSYDQKTTAKTWTLTSSDLNKEPEYKPVFGIIETSPDQIVLNWTNASARVEWFDVQRSSDGGATWTTLTIEKEQTDTRYVDTSALTPSTSYRYQVRGHNAVGPGEWSDVVTAYVPDLLAKSGADLASDLEVAAGYTVTWNNLHTYKVTSTLFINEGQTLIIEKGTRVQFAKPATGTYKILVKGKLVINGTSAEPVVFTSIDPPSPGAWGLIDIATQSDDATYDGTGAVTGGTQLKHLVVEGSSGIKVDGASPYLEAVTIQHSSNGLALSNPPSAMKIRGLTVQDSGGEALLASGGWNLDVKDLNVFRAGKVSISSGQATIEGGEWKSQNLGYYWYSDSANYFGSTNVTLTNIKSDGKVSLASSSGVLDNVRLNGAPLLVSNATSLVLKNSQLTGQTSESYIENSSNIEITGVTTSKAQFSGTLLSLRNINGLNVHHNTWNGNAVTQVLNMSGNSRAIVIGNVFNDPDSTYEINNTGVVGSDVSATYNYWGTTDGAVVNNKILDYYDSFENGKVLVLPRLNSEPSAGQGLVGLIGPAASSAESNANIVFEWKAFGTLSSPTLQVATDQAYTNIVKSQDVTGVEAYTWATPPLGRYYWRVVWAGYTSESREVKPSVAITTTQNGGMVLTPYRLAWSAPAGAGTLSYKVKVGTSSNLVGATEYTTTDKYLDTQVAGLVDGTKYYWKVTPVRDGGEAVDSPVWNSTAQKITGIATSSYNGFFYNSRFKGGLGYGYNYQLGTGTYESYGYRFNIPQYSLTTGLQKIAAFSQHLLAIDGNGDVLTWGANDYGQQGAGNSDTLIEIRKINPSLAVTDIAVGDYHSLYLVNDGSIYTMGRNNYGQLGTGDTSGSSVPVKIESTSFPSEFASKAVSAVAAGGNTSYALMANKQVVAWGYNGNGQLGINAAENDSHTKPLVVQKVGGAPLTDIVAISASGGAAAALDSSGTVWVWGYLYHYDTALGYEVWSTNQAIQVVDSSNVPVSGVAKISMGGGALLMLKTDGTVLSMGSSNWRGTNGKAEAVSGFPGAGDPLVQISANPDFAWALTSSGSIYGWGSHYYGALGEFERTLSAPTLLQFNK